MTRIMYLSITEKFIETCFFVDKVHCIKGPKRLDNLISIYCEISGWFLFQWSHLFCSFCEHLAFHAL
jgi:hypothetical protein